MPRVNNNGFRVQYKNIFLTYPQSDFVNQELLDFLLEKLSTLDPVYIVVCREYHKYPEGHELEGQEDETQPHHHVFIQLNKKPDITNSRLLDFQERHPKWEQAGKHKNSSVDDCRNYTLKDGNFIEWGNYKIAGSKRSKDAVYKEAMEMVKEGRSKEEVRDHIAEHAARDFWVCSGNINARLDSLYTDTGLPYDESKYSVLQFQDVPDKIWKWYSRFSLVRGFHTRSALH